MSAISSLVGPSPMGMHGLMPLMTVSTWLELVGGLLLVLGLFTHFQISAFRVSAFCYDSQLDACDELKIE